MHPWTLQYVNSLEFLLWRCRITSILFWRRSWPKTLPSANRLIYLPKGAFEVESPRGWWMRGWGLLTPSRLRYHRWAQHSKLSAFSYLVQSLKVQHAAVDTNTKCSTFGYPFSCPNVPVAQQQSVMRSESRTWTDTKFASHVGRRIRGRPIPGDSGWLSDLLTSVFASFGLVSIKLKHSTLSFARGRRRSWLLGDDSCTGSGHFDDDVSAELF